jgi:hypothetical protein
MTPNREDEAESSSLLSEESKHNTLQQVSIRLLREIEYYDFLSSTPS